MHEALLFLFPDGVELLGLAESGKSGDGENLSLAAGEQAGAVHHGDNADLSCEGADLVHLASVNALAGEQPLLDDLLLQLVEYLVHVLHHVGVLFAVLLLNHGDPLVDAGFADVLVIGAHAVLHGLELLLDQHVEQLLIKGSVLVLELGLAYLGDHLVDEVENGLEVLMCLNDALVHDVLGNLIGLGLDHDDLLVGGGDGGGHAVVLTLGLGGVEEVLLAVPAEDDAGDGAVEGHVGDGDCGGCADHCGDLGGAVAVNRQDFAGDNDVVAQVGREEGTHGAVDQAGGQNCGQAGLTLAAHEAAGDAADCVELLVEVNGEREVVDAVLGAGGSGAGYENGGVAVLDEDCGVAELCHLADLHGEGAAFVHDLILLVIGELLLGDYHVFISFIFWRSRRLST